MIHRLAQTTSTNDEARRECYADGDIVWAERQTAGRGQRGHSWSSRESEDLTFSLVLEPSFLAAADQFWLLRTVALALADTLGGCGLQPRIKWTNDIYVGDSKIVGVLIENSLEGTRMARTAVGIGINVNSSAFDPSLPNPTSLLRETGRTFDREQLLDTFARNFDALYTRLRNGERHSLHSRYDALLYGLGQQKTYALPDGTPFTAVIRGTEPGGRLITELSDGSAKAFAFKELEFVLKK